MRRNLEAKEELRRGREAENQGNHGRARVCARRAVGAVLAEYHRSNKEATQSTDAVSLLKNFLVDSSLPDEVAEAGKRLVERVRPDFSSASLKPLEDAESIIKYVKQRFGPIE